MVPGQPCKIVAVRTHTRGRIKVVSAGKHALRLRPFERERNYRIDRLALRVVFAHADDPSVKPVDRGLGIAHSVISRERTRLSTRKLAIEPLVRKVRKI